MLRFIAALSGFAAPSDATSCFPSHDGNEDGMVAAQLQPAHEGTMQGGPLSPLLANILLDDFDKELEPRGLRFVRYADDFLVFTPRVLR